MLVSSMSSLEKKRQKSATSTKKKKKQKLTSILSLPDDLWLNCFARISRLYYPTLSLVSKSFRSLLASPGLYKTRSLLGRTQSCLYVCLELDEKYHWFTLCLKPNQTLNSEKLEKISSGYVLATVPIAKSPPLHFPSLVAVGSNIYNIGRQHSSRVLILDCQSHTWHEGPRLSVVPKNLSTSVIDEKIYVAGSYIDYKTQFSKNLFEVFNTKTETWDPKPFQYHKMKCDFSYSRSASSDGNFYLFTAKRVATFTNKKVAPKVVSYIPKEDRWELVCPDVNDERKKWGYMISGSYCVIENVLYSVSHESEDFHRMFRWLDAKHNMWRILSVVGLPNISPGTRVNLADYGGKMAVLWDERVCSDEPYINYSIIIWCAVVSLKQESFGEVDGEVEWFDHIFTVPSGYSYGSMKVLASCCYCLMYGRVTGLVFS